MLGVRERLREGAARGTLRGLAVNLREVGLGAERELLLLQRRGDEAVDVRAQVSRAPGGRDGRPDHRPKGPVPLPASELLRRGRNGESPYREFCDAVTRAEQESVVSLVDLVRSHAVGDWRAAAFLLERRHKKDWGRRETIDATVTSQLDAELERRLLKGREANARGETR